MCMNDFLNIFLFHASSSPSKIYKKHHHQQQMLYVQRCWCCLTFFFRFPALDVYFYVFLCSFILPSRSSSIFNNYFSSFSFSTRLIQHYCCIVRYKFLIKAKYGDPERYKNKTHNERLFYSRCIARLRLDIGSRGVAWEFLPRRVILHHDRFDIAQISK